MHLSSLPLFLLCSVLLAPLGCAAPSSDDAASNDADFTSERSPTPDAPRYSDADAVPDFGGRMRVSLAGGPFTESTATPSMSVDRSKAAQFTIGGALRVDFGIAPAAQIQPGTYSCADGDAAVMLIEQGADKQLVARKAVSCTVVIDEVHPAKSTSYARVYGRFEASANAPDGLPSTSRGAFAGDFPLPR